LRTGSVLSALTATIYHKDEDDEAVKIMAGSLIIFQIYILIILFITCLLILFTSAWPNHMPIAQNFIM